MYFCIYFAWSYVPRTRNVLVVLQIRHKSASINCEGIWPMLLLFRMKWVYHWNTLSIWKICFPVLVHIFYSNFAPPFPLPEPSAVILYHYANAIYAAYAPHTLCTASRPEYIGSYQGANASIYWWGTWELVNIHRKKNPSHQHDNLLRWYRLSKDEAPSCDLAGIYS